MSKTIFQHGIFLIFGIWITSVCHGSKDDCSTIYTAYDRDQLEEKLDSESMTRVSLFALLVDPKPYRNKLVSTAGMMVSGHGRTYLTPVASREYIFTQDAIQIENSQLPSCMLTELEGLAVWVLGIIDEVHGQVIVNPIYVLHSIPTKETLDAAIDDGD